MHLSSIKLTHFRNYESLDLKLTPGLTALVGPNAQGKTNLLEAIYMLSLGKSFRTDSDRDLISHGADFCRIDALVRDDGSEKRIELVVDGQAERISKRIKIEGVSHRRSQLLGQLYAVIFVPDDLNVITLSPSYRRNHLDMTLSQVHPAYARALSEYGKVIRNRNKVLEAINEGSSKENELPYWDKQVIAHGVVLVEHRSSIIRQYQSLISELYSSLTKQKIKLQVVYESCVTDPSLVKTQLAEKILHNRTRDIAAMTTTSGPHREDFTLLMDDHPLASFGSRGEQRTALLALKLAEIEYIKQHTKKTPILLLDDVFSELDETRREQLLATAQPEQTIITTTDKRHVSPHTQLLQIKDGAVQTG